MIQSILERALDADGYYDPDVEKFSPRTGAERRADRRDAFRSVLMITPSEYLASLDDERWQW